MTLKIKIPRPCFFQNKSTGFPFSVQQAFRYKPSRCPHHPFTMQSVRNRKSSAGKTGNHGGCCAGRAKGVEDVQESRLRNVFVDSDGYDDARYGWTPCDAGDSRADTRGRPNHSHRRHDSQRFGRGRAEMPCGGYEYAFVQTDSNRRTGCLDCKALPKKIAG